MRRPFAIILGAAVWPGGEASPTLRRRAETGAALYRAGRVQGIVATGGVGRHPPSEAEVIRELVTALGVPGEAVILEDRSATTHENLANAQALLPADAPAIIVSDFWHLPRARLTARRLGLEATGAAPPLKGSNWARILVALLREAAAFLWYLVRPIR